MQDEYEPDVVRSAEEVARRSLALFSVLGLAFGAPKPDVIEWLDETGLSGDLAPSERRFVEASSPSQQQTIQAGWLSERLVVLCWALRELDALPEADRQCDMAQLQQILPPFADVGAVDFIARARLRPDDELISMADRIMALHWEARNAKSTGSELTSVDIEIIQERHHAINWLIGYDGLAWDEVTTDT